MDTAVEEVLEALKKEAFFWRGKQATKAEVRSAAEAEAFDCTASRSEDQGEARAAVERALSSSGLRKKIKAFAFHRFRAQIQQGRGCGDATAAVDWARQQWAELLLRQLRELSKEQKQPFLRRRPKPLSLSKDPSQAEEVSTRHIVDLKALFSLISSDLKTRQAQESSRHARQGAEQSGGPATVDPVSLEQLRLRFVELSPAEAHLGVPETLDVRPEASKEEPKRRSLGQQLLVTGYPVELQTFCRFGVPASLRREVWSKCLGAVESGTAALQEAARGICEWEWLTDDVLRLDVAEHCANDVSYFPFDELVEALVLALSRDSKVGQLCESGLPQVPLVADAAGALAVQTSELRELRAGGQAMPPSGVVPFKGFSNYACPFAFLADRLETAYPIFRSFYCRHLCRLHTISDHPETLLSLCALFEQLVVSTVPRAAQHLQFVLDSSPLRYAFHWIVTGFVGSLPAEEVLQLWDRVLGFDSVALVPILAAAIVALRSKLILAARRPEEVQLVFSDISCVKAIPLLQSFLFAHELGLGPWE